MTIYRKRINKPTSLMIITENVYNKPTTLMIIYRKRI